jgi:hypothetical protein
MHYKSLEEFILHLENYIECWKQFNHYVNLARDKKFSRDDENQFLEIKSIIAQGLEAIIASADKSGPKKEEVNSLFCERTISPLPERNARLGPQRRGAVAQDVSRPAEPARAAQSAAEQERKRRGLESLRQEVAAE